MLQFEMNNIVCLDSTDGTMQYDFNLITVMVVDDFGEGNPTVFMISNRKDKVALAEFFHSIKARLAPDCSYRASHVMTDDASQYFNAWMSVFGPAVKLLCTWHVDRSWRKASPPSILKEHLTIAGRNATYISPVSQNALIESMSAIIQSRILAEVKQAKFFAILANETTDFSQQEQLTICLRFVSNFSICERFVCFALAPDLTGAGLSSQVLSILDTLGVDLAYMVGQGYDAAAAMSGDKNGVQKHIAAKCPSALYVHCATHSLNLCLTKAADVPEIRAAVTPMNSVAVFYQDSNKRLLKNTFIFDSCTCMHTGAFSVTLSVYRYMSILSSPVNLCQK